jgi:phosphoribosylaminoimidazole (AIR) synthetase
MRECAKWRGLSGEECYNSWNGGQGALVVVHPDDVNRFLEEAARNGIEAKAAGEIKAQQGYNVRIVSKFDGREVIY